MLFSGAPARIRTADLLITNQLLYQLSYKGIVNILHYEPSLVYRLKRLRATHTHGKGSSSVCVHRQYYHVILTYLSCKKHISKLTMRDKRHLVKHSEKLAESKRLKELFRSQRKPVEAGAHGTLNYTIKKGVNKDKIADEKILKNK